MPWLRAVLFVLPSLAVAADWPYGGGPDQTRYSPLTQITRENVSGLKVAWSYDTGDAFRGSEMQCQPVVAHGIVYAASPRLRVFALDAATGALKWSFDPFPSGRKPTRTRIRGLMYWERGPERRIYFAARHWLHALDAHSGKPIPTFGENGRIDLRRGFRGRDPRTLSVGVNTPACSSATSSSSAPSWPKACPPRPATSARSTSTPAGSGGRSTPSPTPASPAMRPGRDAWRYSGGANAWAGLALDHARGLVYASTGSAAYDFYGANRHGDNLFANTILCLRAATGRRVWHFQAVRHDVWDRDFPAAPSLITILKGGRPVDVVAQIAKNGRTYVLDRDTGQPIFPMEEVEAPPSDVPGEKVSSRQVLPSLPPPFTRQRFTEDLITRRTPESERAVREKWHATAQGRRVRSAQHAGHDLVPGHGRRR